MSNHTPKRPSDAILSIMRERFAVFGDYLGYAREFNASGRKKRGSVAGSIDPTKGYRRIVIAGKSFYAHHVAYYLSTGDWPLSQLDHIDQNKLNNSPENLRLATNSENHRNCLARHDNASGVIGVCFDKARKKWEARIRIDGGRKYLGLFHNIADASLARDLAAIELHGNFAYTNDEFIRPFAQGRFRIKSIISIDHDDIAGRELAEAIIFRQLNAA